MLFSTVKLYYCGAIGNILHQITSKQEFKEVFGMLQIKFLSELPFLWSLLWRSVSSSPFSCHIYFMFSASKQLHNLCFLLCSGYTRDKIMILCFSVSTWSYAFKSCLISSDSFGSSSSLSDSKDIICANLSACLGATISQYFGLNDFLACFHFFFAYFIVDFEYDSGGGHHLKFYWTDVSIQFKKAVQLFFASIHTRRWWRTILFILNIHVIITLFCSARLCFVQMAPTTGNSLGNWFSMLWSTGQ